MTDKIKLDPAAVALETILERLMDPELVSPDPGTYYSGLRGGLTFAVQAITAVLIVDQVAASNPEPPIFPP